MTKIAQPDFRLLSFSGMAAPTVHQTIRLFKDFGNYRVVRTISVEDLDRGEFSYIVRIEDARRSIGDGLLGAGSGAAEYFRPWPKERAYSTIESANQEVENVLTESRQDGFMPLDE